MNTCSIVDPDPTGYALILGGWIRIQESKNEPQKEKKFHVSVGCSLLRAEGFFVQVFNFAKLGHQIPGSVSGIQIRIDLKNA